MVNKLGIAFAWAACFATLAGCVVYEPYPGYYSGVPAPAPRPAPTFDRAWNAALGALEDAGVKVASADSAKGVIRGTTDRTDVLVTVSRQADGTIQTEIEAKGPQGRDSGLAGRVSQAYQRRMGL